MSISIKCQGQYGFQAVFKYDANTVALIKRCLGFNWNPDLKAWVSPGPEVLLDLERQNIVFSYFNKEAEDRAARFYDQLDAILQIKQEPYPDEQFGFQKTGTDLLLWQGRGILADAMGLGKSIQSIRGAELAAISEYHNLIITMNSLTYNWQAEVLKWYPDADVGVVPETGPKAREAFWKNPPKWIIANYEKLLLPDWPFDMIVGVFVFDEAQRAKNKRTKTWEALSRIVDKSFYAWALTGTPLEIRLEELYSIISLLRPGIFGSFTRFREQHLITDGMGNTIGSQQHDLLKERIGPWMTRRTKAEVAPWLPPKIVLPPILVEMSKAEKDMYATINSDFDQWVKDQDRDASEMNVLTQLLRLEQFTCSPDILDLKEKEGDRKPWKGSKYEELVSILRDHEDNAVVFTRFKEMSSRLVKWLSHEPGIDFNPQAVIDGDVKNVDRKPRVDAFNAGKLGKVFIFTDAGAFGLNVQGDLVIQYDMLWNPAKMAQREDRLHGIGRGGRDDLSIIYLLNNGTLDVGMYDVLQERQALATEIVDGAEEVMLKSLGKARLMAMAKGVRK